MNVNKDDKNIITYSGVTIIGSLHPNLHAVI